MVEVFEDAQGQSPEQFYASLKEKLNNVHNFPTDYLFKFIIPNEASKLTEIYKVFDQTKNTVSTRESKNGKYVSATIQAFVLDSDQVVNLYKAVEKIDGVIML